MSRSAAALADPVVWHDVECGGYAADLPLWRELAGVAGGPILELGAGTGRVALDLAGRGFEVIALDSDPLLLQTLAARARERGVRVRTAVADARTFELSGPRAALAIAPMQVVQLMGGADGRRRLLSRARAHLRRRGILALAVADPLEGMPADEASPPVPDVTERDGWVFSSTPFALRAGEGEIAIDRLRQTVSPEGTLEESMASITLDSVSAAELEAAGAELGFRALPRHSVEAVGDYVGSTVVLLEAT
ncbi:MAG: class I SAM-dependent methyltransferase [Actinobacteria bacterium]|nr:class I SAM-dependent methyltransferase [Actinomycetota bacterium]